MTFRVQPQDLEGYSSQVGRAAQDAQESLSYINKYGDLGTFSGQGLFLWATGLHSQAMDQVKDVFTRIHDILTASAAELSKSARYYRATDREEAARLDATYPPSKR